ncbi:MAG: peroxiredoxin [Chloroflexota bacterium]
MTLEAGDRAPAFTLRDQDGKPHSLQDYRGQKVVLYFYPKDETPGCTTQACSLRDHFAEIRTEGATVLGVSADDEASHRKFRERHELGEQGRISGIDDLDGLAVQPDLTGVGEHQADQHLHEGRLAGAVLAEQCMKLPGPKFY